MWYVTLLLNSPPADIEQGATKYSDPKQKLVKIILILQTSDQFLL